MYYSTVCPSPVGMITLASDGESILGLWIEGQKYFGGSVQGELRMKHNIPAFDAAKDWLDRYFRGERPDTSGLPLRPAGSPFRQSVWKLLREIPYGKVVTYGDIAKQMAKLTGRDFMSGQAIGNAVGHNPISILIPCHRVVGANGSLTGYAAGIETKRRLLELEGADMSRLRYGKPVKRAETGVWKE